MRLLLTVLFLVSLGELVSSKIKNAEQVQIVKLWPKFELICTKIRVRRQAQSSYADCRPLHHSAQWSALYKQLEDQFVHELKFYQITTFSTTPIEEHQMDTIVNQTLARILQEVRLKLRQTTTHQSTDKQLVVQLIDSLLQQVQNDNSSILSQTVEQLKAKIKNSLIVREKQAELPEILIWFVQEKQLGKRELDYLQRLWAKHAYFQLANYLSQYDTKLKERVSAADPFKFNNNRVLLLELFKRIQRDYSGGSEVDTESQVLVGSSLSVEARISTYLDNNGCEQSYRAKAHALFNRHQYKILIQCLFPNASNTILNRYQQITGNVVLKRQDFVNILNLIDESWMRNFLGHPCHHTHQHIQSKTSNSLNFLESAQQSNYIHNHYYTEDNLTYKTTRLGRRKSPYYYIGTHPSNEKTVAHKYQSYFTHILDL